MNIFRTVLDSIVDCIQIISPDYKIEYMNKPMENRIGRMAIGEECFDVCHGQDKRCDWCEMKFNVFSNNEVIEKKIVSPLDHKTFRVSILPFPKEDGSISDVLIIQRSINLSFKEACQ